MSDFLKIQTSSPEQTQKLGELVGRLAQSGDLILLTGNLGAGKTCFTQGIAWGAGFDGFASSPSFVLVREYQGSLNIYHIDFYRMESVEEIDDIGLDDYLTADGICVIEWADKALNLLPHEYLLISFDYLEEDHRLLRFEPNGKRYYNIINQLKEKWNSQ